jgi:superfamily II DNA or RNA helicase
MRAEVVLLRSANQVVVDPTTRHVLNLLAPELSYVEKRFFHGRELAEARRAGLPAFEEVVWELFGEDHKGRIAFPFGLTERVLALLKEAGYRVQLRWATAADHELAEERARTVYCPRWDRIEQFEREGFQFRYQQRHCLELIARHECGRVSCPPAWGKGTIIVLACMLFPKAKIAVVTKNVPVLHQRLYPELAMNLPSVGIVGGGRKVLNRRVMCYTADSLHHATGEEDFVFIDEGHQACADRFAENVGRIFGHARIWMFSATWDMRLDNKDMRAEAMAGPIRLKVQYHEAVEHGMVVPIEVVWNDVIMDVNPCAGADGVRKKRYGIWTNTYRNEVIAADARRYDADTQVLITVETIEHALHLKKLLPEFTLVYSGQGLRPWDIARFRRKGLVPPDWEPMSDERKARITRRFEQGRLKKVIATPVWNVGVDFKQLQVLIRADAGGSPINDTQIPGRAARRDEAGRKRCGIVHDYLDQFDAGFRAKARGRSRRYAENQWTQHYPRRLSGSCHSAADGEE